MLHAIDPERFGIAVEEPRASAGQARSVLLVVATGLLIAAGLTWQSEWLGIGGVTLLVGLILPSRATLEFRARRRAEELAREELNRRCQRFKAALSEKGASFSGLLTLQSELELSDEEIGTSAALALRTGLEQQEFEAQVAASGLPKLTGYEQFVGDDDCAFAAPVTYDKRGSNDPGGVLVLTDKEAAFWAEGTGGRVAAPWSKVGTVTREGSTLSIQRRDRQTPLLFDCASFGEALRGEFIAKFLLRTSQEERQLNQSSPRCSPAPADGDEPPVGTVIDLPGLGHFTMSIVGESYHQLTLRALAGDRLRLGEQVVFNAVLVPEPTNPYDANAVKIYARDRGHLGYLSRDDAEAFLPINRLLRAQHAVGLCRAKLVGGTDSKPSIGVVLDLAHVNDLMAALQAGEQPF